jgi:hypothetical protein
MKITSKGACGWMTLACGDSVYTGMGGMKPPTIKTCREYDDVPIFNKVEELEMLDDIDTKDNGVELTCGGACTNISIQEVCADDPCNVGPCRWVGGADCVNTSTLNKPQRQRRGCFSPGTLVTMANGTEKNIENIQVGEMVMSWNEKNNFITSALVTSIISPVSNEMIRIVFNDSENLNTTDHPYYVVGKGWASYDPQNTMGRYKKLKDVHQLSVGDKVLYYKEGVLIESEILFIQKELVEMKTYTLGLKNTHTFFANGILVHNK